MAPKERHIISRDPHVGPEEPEGPKMVPDDLYMVSEDQSMVPEEDYSGYGDEEEIGSGGEDGSGSHANADDEDYESQGFSSRKDRAFFPDTDEKGEVEAFSMPVSEIRWKSLAMAHARGRDSPVNSYKTKRDAIDGEESPLGVVMVTFIVAGAVLIVLLMATFFIFAW